MKTIIVKQEKMKNPQAKVKFSVYLPPAMLSELERLAAAESRSVSQQIVHYLKQHVASKDDSIPDFASAAANATSRFISRIKR